MIVAVANLGNELETLNSYLTLTSGDFNLNVTKDGVYSMNEIPLYSTYYIYQSNDSNLASAFRCEGEDQTGIVQEPFVNVFLSCNWYTNLPTKIPTKVPTIYPTHCPSLIPTILPSHDPTGKPTKIPTKVPTIYPTGYPTGKPTQSKF